MVSTHSTNATFFFITDNTRATDKTPWEVPTPQEANSSGTWAFAYASQSMR